MKIQVVSDLHLEHRRDEPAFELPDVGADVLVLAGDIDNQLRGLEWAAGTAVAEQTIYVPGNHEYYRGHLQRLAVEMHKVTRELYHPAAPLYLLDNGEAIIKGVRFLGTTLWTSFYLYGAGEAAAQAMAAAKAMVADFATITFGSTGWFLPAQSVILHRAAVEWLTNKLAAPFDGPTVVVSHHCPHPRSIPERFAGSVLSPAFCSDLSKLIEQYRPALWIHGHTHDAFDYVVPWSDGSGGTRIVCNPRGYPGEAYVSFDPAKYVVVECPSKLGAKACRG